MPELTDARRDFTNEVDRVAHLMCEEMGIDPDELLEVRYSERLTAAERDLPERRYWEMNEEKGGKKEPTITVRMWETMRPHAAVALAGFRAVNRYFMTEK